MRLFVLSTLSFLVLSQITLVFYKENPCKYILTSLYWNFDFSVYNKSSSLGFAYGAGYPWYTVEAQLNVGNRYWLNGYNGFDTGLSAIQIDIYPPDRDDITTATILLEGKPNTCLYSNISLHLNNIYYPQFWYGWIQQDGDSSEVLNQLTSLK